MMSSDYRAVIAEGLGALQARDMARAASLLRAASEAAPHRRVHGPRTRAVRRAASADDEPVVDEDAALAARKSLQRFGRLKDPGPVTCYPRAAASLATAAGEVRAEIAIQPTPGDIIARVATELSGRT